jgi:hypothetical protein
MERSKPLQDTRSAAVLHLLLLLAVVLLSLLLRARRSGIESRWWGAAVSAHIQTELGVHPASYKMGTGSFQGAKVASAWR